MDAVWLFNILGASYEYEKALQNRLSKALYDWDTLESITHTNHQFLS